jgi:MSHA biogenesis protein MshO
MNRKTHDPIAKLECGGGQRGFTLIELVITITLTMIIAGISTFLISGPVRAYADQARRSELVAAADSALLNIGRDVRRALPNSTRVATTASTAALEMLSSVDAVRYRASGALGAPSLELDFATPDGSFSTLGKFTHVTHPFTSTARYLSVYNIGISGADAYELANVMTPAGTTITITDGANAGEDVVTMSPGFKFAYGSPAKRVYLVDGPITYLCDLAEGTLRRFSGYSVAANQSTRDTAAELTAAGAQNALLARNVTACTFTYAPGTSQRAGLVTATLTVAKSGEVVRLLHQVHVENAP